MYARKCSMGESCHYGCNGRKEVIGNNDFVIVCINWIRQGRETIGELLKKIVGKNTATVNFYVTGVAEGGEGEEHDDDIQAETQIQLINGP